MPTRRRPAHRHRRQHITPEVAQAWRRMKELRQQCSCPPRDPKEYWRHQPCVACVEFGKQEDILCKGLHLLGEFEIDDDLRRDLEAAARA